MNRKGFVIHLVLLGLIAAIALFFFSSTDIDRGARFHGAWPMTVIAATQDAQRDLLSLEQIGREQAAAALSVFSSGAIDYGCGRHDGKSLWNSKETYCIDRFTDLFFESYLKQLSEASGVSFSTASLSEGNIILLTDQKKLISSSLEYIPTETVNLGILTSYRGLLLSPFLLKYEYATNMKFPLKEFMAELQLLRLEAEQLVQKCRNTRNLEKCLLTEKKERWRFTSCTDEIYEESARKVSFCLTDIPIPGQKTELLLALDFTPSGPLPVESIAVVPKATHTEIIFEKDSFAEGYNLYYTDWPLDQETFPQSIEDLFSFPEQFALKEKIALTPIQHCPEEKGTGFAYDCGKEIIYILQDARLMTDKEYFLVVTSLVDSEESVVTEFQKFKR